MEIDDSLFAHGDEDLMNSLLEESSSTVREGTLVSGEIIQIDGSDVYIDIGYKSEGIVSISEFKEGEELSVGDITEVVVKDLEDENGLVVLSRRRAQERKHWDKVRECFEAGIPVKGTIVAKVKGGYRVDVGMGAFLPASQVDLRPPSGPEDHYIGQTLDFKVIKVNARRRNVVLSRRMLMEEEQKELKRDLLDKLEVGQLVAGKVKNITDFGAFVDLGGIDGLLHISDMSWGRVNHPSEKVQINQDVEVIILSMDKDRERVSLGMKQKTQSPWDSIGEKYPMGSVVRGKVVSMTNYGAFIELEEGVEGMVHVSEMSWRRRIRQPSEILAIDDIVEARVLEVDPERQRISLGMKQVESNPWDSLDERYPVGSVVKGRVRNLTEYGAFIQIEDGIDGLLHISDLSWTKKFNHPSEMLQKGEAIDSVVLSIDKDNQRVALGLKQLRVDPWIEIPGKYPMGREVEGKVTKIVPFGAFVELEPDLEGLVHVSEISIERIDDPMAVLSEGQEIKAAVTKVDSKGRQIGLSIKQFLLKQDESALEVHNLQQEKVSTSLGEKLASQGGFLTESLHDEMQEEEGEGEGEGEIF